MRVALLAHQACEGDAIGLQVAAKVRHFISRGWDVRLFVESAARLRNELGPYCTPHTAITLWSDAKDRDFFRSADLVIADYGDYFSLLDLLPALAGRSAKIVVEYQGVTPPPLGSPEQQTRLWEAQRRRGIIWCADRVVVHSQYIAREVHDATGYPLDQIQIIPCHVDTAAGPQVRDVRSPLDLRDAWVLLFVGRLAGNKRVGMIVEALARLIDLDRPVHAVVLGDTTDVYEEEANRCQLRATELGVRGRFHLLGRVSDDELQAWYGVADVLVMPSVHEAFCLPVIEAMANGLPVVAARAAALPETVGNAGLTFRADDVEDCVRQIRRTLVQSTVADVVPAIPNARIAIVAPRFGADFAGGAERSLRTIGQALAQAGRHVEVFTTCNSHESEWKNELSIGTTSCDGLTLHRFPVDRPNREAHLQSLEAIRHARGRVTAEQEVEYLRHSLHSVELIQSLTARRHEFDAIIVGPYLFGLTWDVATQFEDQVLLLPCFHDEPFVRFQAFQDAYSRVGGFLFHSPEEQAFAAAELGFNHPNSEVVGTLMEDVAAPATGPEIAGVYVVYCGRYSAEKGVDQLLTFAEQYAKKHPDRFRFVFMGQGALSLPKAPWLIDLGFVTEAKKRQTLAGARALLQLSKSESLSIVALEAWAAGTPVIVHRDCRALQGQINRSHGGMAVREYTEFAAALDFLWSQPVSAERMGEAGQRYVREQYCSRPRFVERLTRALDRLRQPLVELLRARGRERAAQFAPSVWDKEFGGVIQKSLEHNAPPRRVTLALTPQMHRKVISPEVKQLVLPIRVANTGTAPAAATGPAAIRLRSAINVEGEWQLGSRISLPELIAPRAHAVVTIPVSVPSETGSYLVRFVAERVLEEDSRMQVEIVSPEPNEKPFELQVSESGGTGAHVTGTFLEAIQRALAEAHAVRELPTDYVDVTGGLLSKLKKLVKKKLLHNFRKGYVDVLSRQQSQFNEQIVLALSQLADCCAVLDQSQSPPVTPNELKEVRKLLKLVQRKQDRLARGQRLLEQRLAALEANAGLALEGSLS